MGRHSGISQSRNVDKKGIIMSESATPARRGRGGGGAARRAARTAVSFETAKYIERNIPNFEVLTE